MTFSQRIDGDVLILILSGKITIGVGDVQLRETVKERVAQGFRKIVLDLHDVTTIDSSGVGELVSAYTTITSEGAAVKIAGLPAKVSDIQQITQLITVYDVYDTIEEAVAAVRRSQ